MSPLLNGLHHVTAITANARGNLDFYTRVLGMRLVKKTVNQDDVSAYHLFYADALGRPGTDLTFFDWKHVPRARHGAGTISETALRVHGGEESLSHWTRWLRAQNVPHSFADATAANPLPSIAFEDPEGQRLRLVAEPRDGGVEEFHPWQGSPVPLEAAIVGLGAVNLTVRDFDATASMLQEVLGFRVSDSDPALFEVGAGGPGTQLRLLTAGTQGAEGAGGVHHVAWSVSDLDQQRAWQERLAQFRVGSSGLIDRFYFQSLYFRIPGGILFEIATEGPGFTADGEAVEELGTRLSLPPFLENQRARIEAGLVPLETESVNRTLV